LLDVAVEVVREPMLLLLIATGYVYLLLGDLEEAIALVAAIGVVVGISLYQAQKTEHALQALRDLSSPRALVIRDGVATRIPGRDVVRGDRVILREGDGVPADGAVESSANLAVDESLLTGESAPVVKQSERESEDGNHHVPVLLLMGDHEVIYDPARALARARRLIPDFEGDLVPQCAHDMSVSQHRIVDARVLDFLSDKRRHTSERVVA